VYSTSIPYYASSNAEKLRVRKVSLGEELEIIGFSDWLEIKP
jgi:hypothetical protein